MIILDPTIHIWITLALVAVAIGFYAWEKHPLELIAAGVIGFMLLFFTVFPVVGTNGENLLDPEAILAGFANPALITVLALLVVGQALVRTGALEHAADFALRIGRGYELLSLTLVLLAVMGVSAFLNNTPVVVIFIPIMQALAERYGLSASRYMIPLSYAAILGGMTTLIGSSTNLLASQVLAASGWKPLGFFDFTIPGLVLAVTGLVYMLAIGIRLLPPRAGLVGAIVGEGRQFIAQLKVAPGSKVIGEEAVAGMFPSLKDVTVRMIQRGEHAELPPFDGFVLQEGDEILVAATRKTLTDLLSKDMGLLGPELPEEQEGGPAGGDMMLIEGMVTPASRLIGQDLEQSGFRFTTKCTVLGIQRRSRMIRTRMTEIRLEAGDVLLLLGRRRDVEALRENRDVLPMEWSATEVHAANMRWRALLVFLGVVVVAALEIVPIVVTSVIGAGLMVALGALNVRQAARAIDRQVWMVVASALALGAAMQHTGAAAFLAEGLMVLGTGWGPAAILSVFFLFVALMTQVLSNNAAAVLFIPVGVGVAISAGVDPTVFAIAGLLAANCSFVTPIGYQTNMLVMGPGHYRFNDFVRVGLPLTLLLWVVFSFFAPHYYGLL